MTLDIEQDIIQNFRIRDKRLKTYSGLKLKTITDKLGKLNFNWGW